jgi:hypothetical protein
MRGAGPRPLVKALLALLMLLGLGGAAVIAYQLYLSAWSQPHHGDRSSHTPAPGTRSVHVAWDAAGDPRIAGYRVKYGTAPRMYTHTLEVSGRTDAVLTELDPASTYYIVVAALDSQGKEGPPTLELIVPPY